MKKIKECKRCGKKITDESPYYYIEYHYPGLPTEKKYYCDYTCLRYEEDQENRED